LTPLADAIVAKRVFLKGGPAGQRLSTFSVAAPYHFSLNCHAHARATSHASTM